MKVPAYKVHVPLSYRIDPFEGDIEIDSRCEDCLKKEVCIHKENLFRGLGVIMGEFRKIDLKMTPIILHCNQYDSKGRRGLKDLYDRMVESVIGAGRGGLCIHCRMLMFNTDDWCPFCYGKRYIDKLIEDDKENGECQFKDSAQ